MLDNKKLLLEQQDVHTEEFFTFSTFVSGIVLANALLNIYRNNISNAVKVCVGKKDPIACKLEYKIKYTTQLVKKLKESSKKCDNARSPIKCKKSIQKKIAHHNHRLIKLKTKMDVHKKKR